MVKLLNLVSKFRLESTTGQYLRSAQGGAKIYGATMWDGSSPRVMP